MIIALILSATNFITHLLAIFMIKNFGIADIESACESQSRELFKSVPQFSLAPYIRAAKKDFSEYAKYFQTRVCCDKCFWTGRMKETSKAGNGKAACPECGKLVRKA